MPFPMIPTALALGFFLVWVLIGSLLFRDGQLAERRDRELGSNLLPLPPNRSASVRPASTRRTKRGYKNARVRVAS